MTLSTSSIIEFKSSVYFLQVLTLVEMFSKRNTLINDKIS